MPNTDSPVIFNVTSSADLALQTYWLDDRQRQHILLGHRGIAQTAISAVQSTIEVPTHIYRSKTDDNRFLFVSRDVVIGKQGRPMKVIVERVGSEGKIITATWSGNNFAEQLVWDSSGALYTNYDAQHDVLYVSKGATALEYAEDDPEIANIWLRRNDENDTPQGVTIFGLRKLPKNNRDAIFEKVAAFLSVTKDEVELRANVVFAR